MRVESIGQLAAVMAVSLSAAVVSMPLAAHAQARHAQATGAHIKDCQDDNLAADRRIRACTAVINDSTQSAAARIDALAARGAAHDDNEKYDDAIADFTAALKLQPNDSMIFVLRGNAYDSKGDPQRAIADFNDAIRINPREAAAYFSRGTVHEDMGRKDLAIADFRKTLELDPNHDEAKQALTGLIRK